MRRASCSLRRSAVFALVATAVVAPAFAQTLTPRNGIQTPNAADPLAPQARQQGPILSPIVTPTLSPGVVELLKLEGMFSEAVAKGGGKAFAAWFAEDAVTLNNGKAPVQGHAAIAAAAQWDPKEYQLSWYAEGAQVGPSGDTGFTWGHYDAIAKDKNGNPVTSSGRYITFWKKVDGKWKVALDASADDAANPGDCCKLPVP